MAGIEKDFNDVDAFLSGIEEAVEAVCGRVGQKGVEYAREHGAYHDVTGRLRRSNYYEASPDGLVLGNSAPYAAEVEARGHDVVSGAALYAQKLLREECGKR